MTDSLLPPNASPLERAAEDVTARIGAVPVPVDTLFNPQLCPTPLLPWLAWALSVDRWNSAWPESIKRNVIASSVRVHVKKGTVGAVKRALASLGAPAELTQWWQLDPAGPHGTFSIKLWRNDASEAIEFDEVFLADALNTIADTKRKSQHLVGFGVGAELLGRFGFAASAFALNRITGRAVIQVSYAGKSGMGFLPHVYQATRLKAIFRES